MGIPVSVLSNIPENTMFMVAKEWHEYKDTRFIQKIVIK
jgi:hypothetical protein